MEPLRHRSRLDMLKEMQPPPREKRKPDPPKSTKERLQQEMEEAARHREQEEADRLARGCEGDKERRSAHWKDLKYAELAKRCAQQEAEAAAAHREAAAVAAAQAEADRLLACIKVPLLNARGESRLLAEGCGCGRSWRPMWPPCSPGTPERWTFSTRPR